MQKRSLVDKLKNNRVVKFLRNKFSINPIFTFILLIFNIIKKS